MEVTDGHLMRHRSVIDHILTPLPIANLMLDDRSYIDDELKC